MTGRCRLYGLQERYPQLAALLDGLGTLFLANLIWVLASAPLVTLPAATAGLFAVTAAYARGQTPDLLSDFFGAIRRLWLPSTLISAFDLALAALIYADLRQADDE